MTADETSHSAAFPGGEPALPGGDFAPPPSRRQVLRAAGTGLGAAAFAPVRGRAAAQAGAGTGRLTARQAGGRVLDLGQDWKFVLVNPDGITDPTGAYAGAFQPGFDDSAWRAVDVPHDWAIELAPVDSASTGSGTGFLQTGLGWYRKHFTLPPSLAGQRLSVEFDGVYTNATVWLNGQLLGNHPYAYTGYSFDITSLAHTDGTTPNVLAVQVPSPQPSSRWYSGSGILRNVYLVVTGPVHIARHGTFVTTPGLATTIGSGFAAVQVQTDVANDGGTDATVTVAAAITGPDGRPAGHGESTLSVPAGQTARTTVTVNVTRPALWSVSSPHLYSLRTDVRAAGAVVDSTATPFGIRYFSFDPDAGFSLNGQPVKLQGVDLHATEGAIGGAVVTDAIEHQMRLMQSMGVNALRTAHNPPAPELVQICERLGILLMVEAFDCWRTGKVAFDYHLYFDQWSGYDIAEMVNASKNSPAVVLWSIGNETPDTGRSAGPAIAQKLIAAIKAIDTTRPVVMGSDRYRSVPSPGSPPDQIVRMLDGLGVNYNTATSMDGLHAAYPGKFFFCSETSSETSSRGVYAEPDLLNTGENYTPGKRATSSYDNNLASWTMSGEYELKKDRDRAFWQGGFLWAGQDYIGEPTPYDVFPVKTSFFGAMDSAGFPKDAYYLFQSQWTSEPMVHIVPMNWTDHEPGQPVEVWVYSNVATVELFLNGTSLGSKSFDQKQTTSGHAYLETTEPTGDDFNYPSGSYTSPNGSTGKLHLTWTVPFRAGRLEAVATRGGRQVARDAVTTAGPAHRITLATTAAKLRADGTSLAFVTAAITDRAGVLVPSASNQLSFTVSGPGRVAGTDNGQQENANSYQASSLPAFSGRALAIIQSSGRPGLVTVTATAPGLAPGSLTLPAVPARSRPAVAGAGRAAGGAVLTAAAAPAAPGVTADASFSGAPGTLPAAMLDGDPATGWSTFYVKVGTANLHAVSVSSPADWVTVSWPQPQSFDSAAVSFITGGALALPASLALSYWNGQRFVPVTGLAIGWATASGQPTTLTFAPVTGASKLRLDMTSAAPGTAGGFLRIAELQVLSNGTNIARPG